MLKNNHGLALVMVIGMILTLLILSGAILMISTGHFTISHHQIVRTRAYYAAEAGIQHALWQCRRGGYDLNIAPGNSLIPADSPITIQSRRPNNELAYSLDANIEIFAVGEAGAPSGTHRINVIVDYFTVEE